MEQPSPKPVVLKSKAAAQKKSTGSKRSTTEPVVPNKRQRRASPGDARINLTTINPTAKNKDVVKGTKLQIKVKHTVYNATVTKALSDERVKVCIKDKDPTIAKIEFKIVRPTEEQAKSDKTYGFTSKKANVGFPVEGAHDS